VGKEEPRRGGGEEADEQWDSAHGGEGMGWGGGSRETEFQSSNFRVQSSRSGWDLESVLIWT
jgi:hypothetical protein